MNLTLHDLGRVASVCDRQHVRETSSIRVCESQYNNIIAYDDSIAFVTSNMFARQSIGLAISVGLATGTIKILRHLRVTVWQSVMINTISLDCMTVCVVPCSITFVTCSPFMRQENYLTLYGIS